MEKLVKPEQVQAAHDFAVDYVWRRPEIDNAPLTFWLFTEGHPILVLTDPAAFTCAKDQKHIYEAVARKLVDEGEILWAVSIIFIAEEQMATPDQLFFSGPMKDVVVIDTSTIDMQSRVTSMPIIRVGDGEAMGLGVAAVAKEVDLSFIAPFWQAYSLYALAKEAEADG